LTSSLAKFVRTHKNIILRNRSVGIACLVPLVHVHIVDHWRESQDSNIFHSNDATDDTSPHINNGLLFLGEGFNTLTYIEEYIALYKNGFRYASL
jgi:hypothetical protein